MARLGRGSQPVAAAHPHGGEGGGSSSSTAPSPAPQAAARGSSGDAAALWEAPGVRGLLPDTDRGGDGRGGAAAEAAPNPGAAPASAGGLDADDLDDLAGLAALLHPPEPPAAPRSGGYTSDHFAPAAEAAAAVDRGAAAQLREAQEAREEQQRRSSPRGVPEAQPSPHIQDESSSGGEDVRLDVQADGDADGAGKRPAASGGASGAAGHDDLDRELEAIFVGVEPASLAPRGLEPSSPEPLGEPQAQVHTGDVVEDLAQTKGSSIVMLDERPSLDDQEEEAGGNDDGEDRVPAESDADGVADQDQLKKSRMFKPFLGYSRCVSRCPWCCFFLYLFIVIVLTMALWRPINLDNDLSSFVSADGQASRYFSAFMDALDEQEELNNKFLASGRRLEAGYEEWTLKAFQVVYASRDGLSILDERAIEEAQRLENRLRSLPGWADFCYGRSTEMFPRWLCDPGESMVAYSFPTQAKPVEEKERFRLQFNRRGSEQLSPSALFEYFDGLLSKQDLRGDPLQYLPKDFDRGNLESAPPDILRSKFTFPIVYGDYRDPANTLAANLRKVNEEYSAWLTEKVYPILSTASDEMKYIDVFYSSTELDKYEVTIAMERDILWALGSIAFVTAYMGFHVRSLPFTAGAFFCIFASVPMAYVLVPTEKTTFASLMSLFLITVIDIDIIFVFNDFWKQSGRFDEVDVRLAWTIVRAGRSCLATSLTTSVSFFANLLSALQPLREFGLFMGLCVTNVFVLALMLLPPLIVIRERKEARAKRRTAAAKEAQEAKPGAMAITSGEANSEALEPLKLAVDGGVAALGEDRKQQERARRSRIEKSTTTCTNIVLYRMVDCISACPCLIILSSTVCVGLFFWGIIKGIALEEGLPKIFQPGHNQIRGKELLGEFHALPDSSMAPLPNMNITVCNAPVTGTQPTGCDLFWCNLAPQEATSFAQGSCWRGPTQAQGDLAGKDMGFSVDECESVIIYTQLMTTNLSILTEFSKEWEATIRNFSEPLTQFRSSFTTTALQPVIMEDWESGKTVGVSNYQVSVVNLERPKIPGILSWCNISAICSFGPTRCETPGWIESGRFDLNVSAARRLEESAGRALREDGRHRHDGVGAADPRRLVLFLPTLPDSKQISVAVLFGIWAPKTTPLVGARDTTWAWDTTFEPDNPWSQRAVMAMCDPNAFPEALLVVRFQCWVADFQASLVRGGHRFPSRNFDQDVATWFRTDFTGTAKEDLWMVDGKMRASRLNFWADFSSDSGAEKALAYKANWDAFVELRNSEATLTGKNAWHTSSVWVRSEAQVAIISSTTDTIVTELILGWLGILAFTGDPVLAIIVLCLIIGNVGGLACFMVQVMGWAIGPIEIIFLVVFLGYSVTFGLHMALNYNQVKPDDPALVDIDRWIHRRKAKLAARRKKRREPPPEMMDLTGPSDGEFKRVASPASSVSSLPPPTSAKEMRKARTRMAVLRVGGAIFSSTVSTIGSSIFLLFCTLNIFIRLGWVIIAVVTLSLVTTLVVLPAVLVLIGPGPRPWYKRIPAELFEKLFCRLRPRRTAAVPNETPLLM